jgi:hypothetical protein
MFLLRESSRKTNLFPLNISNIILPFILQIEDGMYFKD